MKREIQEIYLLFVGEDYYPRGGWLDLKSEHETLEEALAEGRRRASESDASYKSKGGEKRNEHINWFQIVSVVCDSGYTTPVTQIISHVTSEEWSDETNTHQWVERSGFMDWGEE